MNPDTNSPYCKLLEDVATAAKELETGDANAEHEADVLFWMDEKAGAKVYFVSGDGRTSTFDEPSSVQVLRVHDHHHGHDTSLDFLQSGGWTHPLVKGAAPVLETHDGTFVFPDVYDPDPQAKAAVALVLPAGSQEQLDQRQLFREVLQQNADLATEDEMEKGTRKQTETEEEQQEEEGEEEDVETNLRLGKTGRKIFKGGMALASGLERGAKAAADVVKEMGRKEREKCPAVDAGCGEGGQAKKPPGAATTAAAKGARLATTATVAVSGAVAKVVGKLTRKVADRLAASLEKPVLSASGAPVASSNKMRSSSMRNLADAARGGLLAYGAVYAGLEDSAKMLGKCVKEETVKVIQHRKGAETANVADDALTAAGNAAMTYMNLQGLGAKGLLKKTAKETGRNLGKRVLDAHAQVYPEPQPTAPSEVMK